MKEIVQQEKEDTARASSIVVLCSLFRLVCHNTGSCPPILYALVIEHCERKRVPSEGMFSKRTESNEIMLKLLFAVISLSDLE